MVRVWLIGGLRIEVDGTPVRLPRGTRARAVLAWLALHPGEHRRTEVAARFWPDVLDASARNSLRGALVAIRDAAGAAIDGVLTATRDTIGLALGPGLWVDVHAVRARVAAGELTGALELGDGELLADLDDDWARDAREDHRRLLAELLARLAAEAEAGGDLAGAVGWSWRAVSRDPLSEEAHRQLMRRLDAAGDRGAALAVFERLAERLRRELRVAPSSATRELAAALRGDHESPAAARPGVAGSPVRPPVTRYARSGEAAIAYQVIGEGPVDVVFIPGFVSHLDGYWAVPPVAAFFERLAAGRRLILYDKRGSGMSDPVVEVPSMEQRMDDTRAVMDAVGCQRAALLGISEGGPLALLFAATYPERAAALILYGAFAHGWPGPRLREYLDAVDAGWGSAALYERLVPSRIDDLQLREAWAGYQRLAASPAMAAGLLRMADAIDVRPILPSVRTPTLVLHRPADPFVDIELGRELAAGLPHARYLEQPGPDHWPFFDGADELHRAVDDFLTAERAHLDVHRALLTLLVLRATGEDRVDPAEPAIAQELARWRGQRLRAGDHDTMLVAAFDGPARAIRCATALLRATRQGCVRAGLHTGECELAGDRVDGLALRVAAHTAATARPGEALATRTTHDVVAGSGLRLTARGSHAFPDTPGSWELYAVQ